MKGLKLPNQMIWHLTWVDIAPFVQTVHQASMATDELRLIVVGGERQDLCDQLHHFIQQDPSSARLHQPLSSHTSPELFTNVPGSIQPLLARSTVAPTDLEPNVSPPHPSPPATVVRMHFDGVDAGLLFISAQLQVWIQCTAIAAPETPSLPLQTVPPNHPSEASTWQVVVTTDPGTIQAYLSHPIAVSAVQTLMRAPAGVTPATRFWNHLLQPLDARPPVAAALPNHIPDTALSNGLDATDAFYWHAPIGMFRAGLDGSILHANPAFCQLVGYSAAQLRRLDMPAISHPEDFALEVQAIQRMLQAREFSQTLYKRYQHRNGSTVWTQSKLQLIGDWDSDEGYLLGFVTDLTEQKQAEQELQHQREREMLLTDIAVYTRTTLELPSILQVAVDRLRQALQTDRVVVYQLFPDGSGICSAESVAFSYPVMQGQTFNTDCIPPPYLDAYQYGRLWQTSDVSTLQLTDCHRQQLAQMQVRSMLAVGISSFTEPFDHHKRMLWGLLVAHHCQAPRQWTEDEQQLTRAVASQVEIAVEQTRLLQELKDHNQELEHRVRQRTQSLERSLQFEQLIRTLTEALLDSLDDHDLLNAAVAGLLPVLDVDLCWVGLLDAQQQVLQVAYEARNSNVSSESLIGRSMELQEFPAQCRQQLLAGASWSQIVEEPTTLASLLPPDCLQQLGLSHRAVSIVVSPIVTAHQFAGILVVLQPAPMPFDSVDIQLIEQVSNCCAIALQQASLYHQEHEQRLSAQYFRTFLENAIEIFAEYDADLRYVAINSSGCKLLQRPRTAIIGKTNQDILGREAESVEQLLQHVLATGEQIFINHEIVLPQGKRMFESYYAPISSPSGHVHRVIGVSRDVTEFKQQWQQLEYHNHRLEETTRMKQEFVATTSHELRTPLTAILGFSNVLLQKFFGDLNPKQQDYIERIYESGQHLLDLINDILDLSRLEAERLELECQTVFVPDLCEGAISLIQERAAQQNLTLEVNLAPDVEWMVVDPRRLKQMLLNLLTNAVKFTPTGCVGLTVFCGGLDHDKPATDPVSKTPTHDHPANMIYFEVWDTGIGIAEADQQRLFSPFSQIDSSLSRQHQGTGLGLAITRKLAELHGGTVHLDSQPGQGSRFTLVLPLGLPSPWQ